MTRCSGVAADMLGSSTTRLDPPRREVDGHIRELEVEVRYPRSVVVERGIALVHRVADTTPAARDGEDVADPEPGRVVEDLGEVLIRRYDEPPRIRRPGEDREAVRGVDQDTPVWESLFVQPVGDLPFGGERCRDAAVLVDADAGGGRVVQDGRAVGLLPAGRSAVSPSVPTRWAADGGRDDDDRRHDHL